MIAQIVRTDDIGFHGLSLAQTRYRLDDTWRSFHCAHTLLPGCLIFIEETSKEASIILFQVGVKVLAVVELTSTELASLRVDRFLWGLVGIHSFRDDSEGFVAVQEVWVGGVDVTCLSSYHVADELVGGSHE